MKRNMTAAYRKLAIELGQCRICGRNEVHAHHIVARSIVQCDEPENIVGLCGGCHRAVHDHALDLGPHLTRSEAAKAVLLMGTLSRAYEYLYPSESWKRAAA
jgi:5-methylcytosine-specific restriction endonuclease McrA